MKKLVFVFLCLLAAHNAFGWGAMGHDVVAYVAENHLTPRAAKRIDKILEGRSMVYYANWLDIASHQPEYAYTKTWHYLNVDEGYTVETMPKNPKGDVLTAVTSIAAKLKAGGLSPKEESDYLKMLVHLVGDMHSPLHLGRLNDLGGNKRTVTIFRRKGNLHSAWDSAIDAAAHKWSYTEWQRQIDRGAEVNAEALQAGTPLDWIKQTHDLAVAVYADTPEGTDISYDYVAKYGPVIETQYLRGGYRLAMLLNDIYGK